MKDILAKKYAPILDDPEAFARAIQRPLPGVFWWNPRKGSPEAILAWMQNHGIETTPLGWHPHAWKTPPGVSIGNTLPHLAGWCCIQEEVALTAVRALDPQPGELVCDMCASPGGKTAQLSMAVGALGGVVANEKSTQRLAPLGSKVDHLGLVNVTVTHADAASLSLLPSSFDRVLADVPCSGEGTVRKFREGPRLPPGRLVEVLPRTQEHILRRALRLAKPGGVVVYSTCTFNPEENESVLDRALGDLGVVEPFDIEGFHGAPGLARWEGREFRSDVSNARRYYPHHNDTGGFFVARIRRTDVPYRREPPPRDASESAFEEIGSEERARVLRWLEQRYGIMPEAVNPFRLFAKGRYMRIASQASPEANARVSSRGVSGFERTQRGFLIQAYGAQLLGPLATRNVVDLDGPDELRAFISGETLRLDRYRDLKGMVLVRQGEFHLGKGSIVDGLLESHLPNYLRLGLPDAVET